MRALALYGTIGSLLVTALATAPAGGATGATAAPPAPVAHRIGFGRCAPVEHLPSTVECGTAHRSPRLRAPRRQEDPPDRQPGPGHRARPSGRAPWSTTPAAPAPPAWTSRSTARLPEWKRSPAPTTSSATRRAASAAPRRCPARTRSEFAKAPTAAGRTPPRRSSGGSREAQGVRPRLRRAGPARTCRTTTPLNNARDLDVLRAALGEKKLTFMGASYGTYFGAVYATLFPGHVRRMVFDSVVNPRPGRSGTATTSTSPSPSSAAGATSGAGPPGTTPLPPGHDRAAVQRAYERRAHRLRRRAGGRQGRRRPAPGGVPAGRVQRRLLADARARRSRRICTATPSR